MGAENIELRLKGKASSTEIEKAFKSQQEQNRIENGRRSYTGDFQTVDRVDDRTSLPVFENYNVACEYCLEHAQKWDSVVAVYYYGKEKTVHTLIAGWGAC